jgi:hypothetical protein
MREYENEFGRIIACCFSGEDADIYRQVFETS